MVSELDKLRRAQNELVSELLNSQNENMNIQQQLGRMQEQMTQLELTIDNKDKEIDNLREEKSKLTEDLKIQPLGKIEEINNLKNTVERLELQNSLLVTRIEKEEELNHDYKMENNNLRTKLDGLKDTVTRGDIERETLMQAAENTEDLLLQLKNTQISLADKELDLETMKMNLDELRRKNAALMHDCDEYKRSFMNREEEVTSSMRKNENLLKDNFTLQEKQSVMEKSIASLSTEIEPFKRLNDVYLSFIRVNTSVNLSINGKNPPAKISDHANFGEWLNEMVRYVQKARVIEGTIKQNQALLASAQSEIEKNRGFEELANEFQQRNEELLRENALLAKENSHFVNEVESFESRLIHERMKLEEQYKVDDRSHISEDRILELEEEKLNLEERLRSLNMRFENNIRSHEKEIFDKITDITKENKKLRTKNAKLLEKLQSVTQSMKNEKKQFFSTIKMLKNQQKRLTAQMENNRLVLTTLNSKFLEVEENYNAEKALFVSQRRAMDIMKKQHTPKLPLPVVEDDVSLPNLFQSSVTNLDKLTEPFTTVRLHL
ncbi:hypothetical protein PCE1_001191 [Barthelona sp. PCE]